jgi:Domain of unknown function (DUF222)
MTHPLDDLAEAKRLLGEGSAALIRLDLLGDDELIKSTLLIEDLSRQLDALKAVHAAELAWRSRRELGAAGLAAKNGHIHGHAFLKQLTRVSYREASSRIRVGEAIQRAERGPVGDTVDEATTMPFDSIGLAVSRGELAVESADRVLRTLEPVADRVDAGLLGSGVDSLAQEGRTNDADQLTELARSLRDRLDRPGVHEREEQLRSRRALRKGPVVDGIRRMILTLDPESDAIVSGAIDAALSPRLGGPRFVEAADRERAERLIEDARTNDQLALDALVELVRIGVDNDKGEVLGSQKPAVRVTISLDDLLKAEQEQRTGAAASDRAGVAWLEGSSEPVSAATARRYLCDRGALPIVLSGVSEPLDLGRTRRLFSGPQRTALALRDGGCRWPGCDRPPSWCEAHHITPFSVGGKTDLADGILLCRAHHMLLHNNGWQITRDGSCFSVSPPRSDEQHAVPREMPSKSPHRRSLPSRRNAPQPLTIAPHEERKPTDGGLNLSSRRKLAPPGESSHRSIQRVQFPASSGAHSCRPGSPNGS